MKIIFRVILFFVGLSCSVPNLYAASMNDDEVEVTDPKVSFKLLAPDHNRLPCSQAGLCADLSSMNLESMESMSRALARIEAYNSRQPRRRINMISFACSHVTAEGLALFFAWYQKPANKAPLYVNFDCNPCGEILEGITRGWDDFDHLWISAILSGDGMFASYDNFGGLRAATTNFNSHHIAAQRAKGVTPRSTMNFKSSNAESAERRCDWEQFAVASRFGIDDNGTLVPFPAPTTEKEALFFAIKNTLDELLNTGGKESMSPVGIVINYMGYFCVVDFSAV